MKSKTFILRNQADAEALGNSILGAVIDKPLRVVVEVYKKKRSIEQNKLQRKWLNEAADQLKEFTAEEYRGYCKLHFGVPILRSENEDFREAYDRVIRPLSYEKKILCMCVPLDFQITRLMDTKQHATFLDAMYQFFTGLGAKLTDPKHTDDAFDEMMAAREIK